MAGILNFGDLSGAEAARLALATASASALQAQQTEENRLKNLGTNALRNIYGDIAGNPAAAQALDAMKRAQELHPGALLQQGATLDQTRATTANTQANTELTQATVPGRKADSGLKTLDHESEAENAQWTAGRIGIRQLKIGLAAGGDPVALLERLGPQGLAALDLTPEDMPRLAQAIRIDPTILDRMDAEIAKRQELKRQSQVSGKSTAHLDQTVHARDPNSAGGWTITYKSGRQHHTDASGNTIPSATVVQPGGTGGAPGTAPAKPVGHIKTPEYRGATKEAEKRGEAAVPKLTEGEVLATNPATGKPGVFLMPNTKAATERVAEYRKTDERVESTVDYIANVDRIIDRALKNTTTSTTGAIGAVAGLIPGSKATDLKGQVQAIQTYMFRKFVDEMRAASSTGGLGLGNLNQQEVEMLRSSLGTLDTAKSAEEVRTVLNNVRRVARTALVRLTRNHLQSVHNRVMPGQFAPEQMTDLPTPAPEVYQQLLQQPTLYGELVRRARGQ